MDVYNSGGNKKMSLENIKFSNNERFLVTGGAGFIGSNIVEFLLNSGYKVRVLDNLSTGKYNNISPFLNNENFEFINGDIRNAETCFEVTKGIDFVMHQAALGSVPRSIEMPVLYNEINITGTLNMLEASRQNSVKKFVYASSSSVYGDETTLPKVEGKEGNLLSPYALTKLVNEKYANLYNSLYGLETVGLRYFNVFGRRQDPEGQYAAVIPRFVSLLLQGKAPTINGDGFQSRDFTYIDNVIEANLKACLSDKKASGKAYNIAYGGRENLNDIYNLISGLLGVEIAPIYGQERKGDIKHSNANISAAKNNLKYDPSWSFSDGIREAIDWYKANL